jgi:hypothetical protein
VIPHHPGKLWWILPIAVLVFGPAVLLRANQQPPSSAWTPIDPTSSNIVYAGGDGGIYKSVDGGATWSPAVLLTTPVIALAVDPAAPSTVYAGTFDQGVLKSSDDGASWAPAATGLPDQRWSELGAGQYGSDRPCQLRCFR